MKNLILISLSLFLLLFKASTVYGTPQKPYQSMQQRLEQSMHMKRCAKMLTLPIPDQNGRRKTENFRGFEDSIFSETQLKFLKRAAERAQHTSLTNHRGFTKQKVVLEIGTAFGTFAKEIVKAGAYYWGVDMERKHVKKARQELKKVELYKAQTEVFVGTFPYSKSKHRRLHRELTEQKEAFEISDIGAFQMGMYLNPEELVTFFQWVFDTLPSGGQFFLTGISPFCNLFPQYDQLFKILLLDGHPFPGWIEDVRKPEMRPFVPDLEDYLSKYPPFFHLLDKQTLKRIAETIGFIDVETEYLRRKFPEKLVYLGTEPNVGELVSFIGTKP